MWEPTSSDSLLSVENLGIQREGRWILKDITFSLAPGEALGVVGESGAGKTTLAWTILGLLAPAQGSIRLAGLPWSSMSEAQRRPHRPLIQAVFQDPQAALPPHLTGWEILEEPLVVHRRSHRRETAATLADRVKFPLESLDQKRHQWSTGLAQRLCLARALMLRPRILVLDEPLSALDATLGGHLLELLKALKAEGLGLLFISHQMPAVQQLCDRVLRLGAPFTSPDPSPPG